MNYSTKLTNAAPLQPILKQSTTINRMRRDYYGNVIGINKNHRVTFKTKLRVVCEDNRSEQSDNAPITTKSKDRSCIKPICIVF